MYTLYYMFLYFVYFIMLFKAGKRVAIMNYNTDLFAIVFKLIK